MKKQNHAEQRIALSDVTYDETTYARKEPNRAAIKEYIESLKSGDGTFPPIILEEGTNKLLDGFHRWTAYKQYAEQYKTAPDDETWPAPPETIPVEYHSLPEGITARLYSLWLNTKHGLRVNTEEKKQAAIEQYKATPGINIAKIARYCNVTEKTASFFIKELVAEFDETRQSIIWRLDSLGWTQQEISEQLDALFPEANGTSRRQVSELLAEIGNYRFPPKSELDKGLSIETVAKRHSLPEQLVYALAGDDKSDEERLALLDIKVQPYDVWQFATCHDFFGNEYPGRIPGQLVAHILYFFTKAGDLVIDPMVGSGTTLDACLLMHRHCYGYDLDNHYQRPDVKIHDLATGWPDRTAKADLIFWDPPYFSKKDDGYVAGSISELPADEYLAFFQKALPEAKRRVKKGTRFAFVMSDWDDPDSKEGIFIWDYADLFREAGWRLIRQIQAPLSTQQVHPDIVLKFRQSRRLARLERYVLIAEA